VWRPETSRTELLILASVHGDEPETTVVLSDALRAIDPAHLKNAAVLCCNPDGLLRGTRANAIGVDLNRNLPTANWSPEPVPYKSRRDGPQDIELSPGAEPGSEPETRALLSLIEELEPRAVVSLHGALACIDDEQGSQLGTWLAERSGLPLEPVSYPTPGSFGSWCREHNLTLVTYELEAASLYDLKERHAPVLIELLTGAVDLGD
jgi:protein MpaA